MYEDEILLPDDDVEQLLAAEEAESKPLEPEYPAIDVYLCDDPKVVHVEVMDFKFGIRSVRLCLNGEPVAKFYPEPGEEESVFETLFLHKTDISEVEVLVTDKEGNIQVRTLKTNEQ